MHEYSETVTRKAGCGTDGELVRTCGGCGDKVTEAIPATGKHTWDKGKVTLEPTIKAEGERTYICTTCNIVRTESIEKLAVNVADYVDPFHLRTTNNPDNYVDFRINGNVLTVSGKIIQDYLESVWVRCDGEGTPVNAVSGELFTVEISLEGIKDKADISVYTKGRGDEYYWSYIRNCIFVEYTDGEYRIKESMVLAHNLEQVEEETNPAECVDRTVSEELLQLSQDIVGDEKDEYKKLYLINKWIAENIFYDYDYYYNSDNEIHYYSGDVYKHKRTVCEGYANLQRDLILAQGIPCVKVVTYSAGLDTVGHFDESNYRETKGNHAHVEAYVNGRWIYMDSTWDSNNKYENGEYIYKAPTIKYFDVTLEYFSYTHKILKKIY
ncbi:MAG: transglutaminase domain-containing protein [Lachnospiraceae bacterium]|nr:transglutaminase domain-containing protein [Lachnospiraceae bacterium]